jgi:hypothetical protein
MKTNFRFVVADLLRGALSLALVAALGQGLKADPVVSLVNLQSSGTPIVVGDTFSLDAVVSDATATEQLDAYDLQLSGIAPPDGPTALPAGIELTGFSDPLGAIYPDNPTPNTSAFSFSNFFSDTSDEPTIGSTPITLATANFTALAPGDYMIYFAPVDSGVQDLFTYDANSGEDVSLGFTEFGAEVDVIPEPSVNALLGAGFLLALGWRMKRTRTALL